MHPGLGRVERGRLVKLGHWWGGRWLADGNIRGEVLLAGEALHLPAAESFGIWWTPASIRAPLLTAWVGGPKARAFDGIGTMELAARALDTLATELGVDRAHIGDLLISAHRHDWAGDPFARGAYSYVTAGGTGAAERLTHPVDGTLFLAGEATAPSGMTGTVHGAIASGERAARQVLEGSA